MNDAAKYLATNVLLGKKRKMARRRCFDVLPILAAVENSAHDSGVGGIVTEAARVCGWQTSHWRLPQKQSREAHKGASKEPFQ